MSSGRATVVNIRIVGHAGSDVYIGRPSVFGCPFRLHSATSDRERRAVIEQFRRYAERKAAEEPGWAAAVRSLHGKRLGCFCAPLPCHGDVLAEIAERLSLTCGNPAESVENLAGC